MNKNGIALILVVSILTVVAITVVSFIFTMRLESRAAGNYLWQQKARYIAEAGIVHARALLKEDKENDFLDSYEDSWRSTFAGNDIDNNDDGINDSRWINLESDGELIGRYAVLVEDEAAKININSAGFHNESPLKAVQGASLFEVSLKDYFSAKGISLAQDLAKNIIAYRYGLDGAAGEKGLDDNLNATGLGYDGIDNDADGEIDEPQEGIDEPAEFSPSYPYGDDRPFLSSEQIRAVSGISAGIYHKIKNEISAYSQTASVNRNRDLQQDLNNIDLNQLMDVFLRSGVTEPWQKAVNLVDFIDADFAQSIITKSGLVFYTQNQGLSGDWQWLGDHYESSTYQGIKGTWTWTGIAAGEYFLILHGQEPGECIGDVTMGELTQTQMRSGEAFNVFPSGTINIVDAGQGKGSLTLALQNNEPLGTTCYFKYFELYSAQGAALGAVEEFRGAEGIRINEIMAQPIIELAVDEKQPPGGHWLWETDHYVNTTSAGGIVGEGTWTWEGIVDDGEYYLTVFAQQDDQIVGTVLVNNVSQANMRSADRFTARPTVRVDDGALTIAIQNNLLSGSCHFKSIILSRQPDAEYIELVNLTPDQVLLGGWSIEVSGTDGWPASIPLGTVIAPGSYLVLAVDQADDCSGLEDNGISFEGVWGSLPCAQLDFSRSVADYSDMIPDQSSTGKGEVILRDAQGNIVDIQEYLTAQIHPDVSLEKADPTYQAEVSEVWLPSLDLARATPANKNNNAGIIERAQDGSIIIEHDLSQVAIKNGPAANLGEIAQAPSGENWQKISVDDLRALADRLTVYGLRLEAEGHKQQGGWAEEPRLAPDTNWFVSSGLLNETGTWAWDMAERIPNGVYNLYLYGKNNEAVSISWHLADGLWSDFTPWLTPGANNSVYLGRIEIGTGGAGCLPAQALELRLKNVSNNQIAHFDYIYLSPLPYLAGKININTAALAVLQALPKIDQETAQRIINNRPLGNKEDKARGIGDVLYADILDSASDEKIAKFSAISNLITVRSDSFQVIVTGQLLRSNQVIAEKRIRAVVGR